MSQAICCGGAGGGGGGGRLAERCVPTPPPPPPPLLNIGPQWTPAHTSREHLPQLFMTPADTGRTGVCVCDFLSVYFFFERRPASMTLL